MKEEDKENAGFYKKMFKKDEKNSSEEMKEETEVKESSYKIPLISLGVSAIAFVVLSLLWKKFN